MEKAPIALVFGAILGVSSPGFDCHLLAWVGVAPLLVLLRGANSRFEASVLGFIYGLGYYLVALSWYLGLFPLRWLGLDDWVSVQAVGLVWMLESVHESLLFAAFSWLVYSLPLRAGFLPHFRRPFFPYLIAVPLIWVFFHWVVATSELFLGMPVNQLAYTQHGQLEFIQLARIGGSGLVDFILLMANCAVAEMILELAPLAARLDPRSDQIAPKIGAWVDIVLVSCVVAIVVSWGGAVLRKTAWECRDENENHLLTQTPAIPVALLQPNVTIEEDKLKTTPPSEIAMRYAKLGTATGAMMLFFPEGAVDPKQFAPGMLLSKIKGIVMHERKEALVGTVETVQDGLISAARLIASPLPKDNIYVKQRLVPFGETAPLGPLGAISSQLTATVPGTGTERLVNVKSAELLSGILGKVGVSISTEVIFPNLISEEVRRGAQLLVNLNNLNRFHKSNLNKQVLAAATLRAVENGRYMVLATNSGISAVIDPSGMVTSRSYAGKRGVLLDTVQFLYNKTTFNKMSRMWWL